MNIETNRLSTFSNWPASTPVDPIRIAKAGFFYTGEGTEVQCFSCDCKISEWNYGDQVMWRHRQLEPNCIFVVNPQLSGNVPLVLGNESPIVETSATSWSMLNEAQSEASNPPDYGRTEDDEMYKSDALRLLSFISWNDTSVSRESLVNAGFYHVGEGRLRCAWCGGELAPFRNFGSLGPPLEVHRMYFPRCEYAASLELQRSNAISPSFSPPSDTPPIQSPSDATDNNFPQSSGAEHNARLLTSGGTWRSLGVVGGGARHPHYASLASRLATFNNWPADRQQSPKALADAGFFHTGVGDRVRCFYCDGGLGMWEAGDAPWSEHAHWFPHCGYVQLVRGHDPTTATPHAVPTESSRSARRRNSGVNFPITESQVDECMESNVALAALGAGLDAARVRRTIARRLRSAGVPFSSSSGLIDAVLDSQLGEEPWPEPRPLLARHLLSDPRTSMAQHNIRPENESNPVTRQQPTSPTIQSESRIEVPGGTESIVASVTELRINDNRDNPPTPVKSVSLEEENRQLKEARLCKVCMDSEVGVVFLPCGHLVSCARCGAALGACPLCRAAVQALVRAYLA